MSYYKGGPNKDTSLNKYEKSNRIKITKKDNNKTITGNY